MPAFSDQPGEPLHARHINSDSSSAKKTYSSSMRQLLDDLLRGSLEVVAAGDFPQRAEVASKGAALGGADRGQRLHLLRVVGVPIGFRQRPIREREVVQI